MSGGTAGRRSGRRGTERVALAALVLALVAAGCGGDEEDAPAGADDTPPAAVTTGEAVDACELLTDGDIEEATGVAPASEKAGSVQGIYRNGCQWELEAGDDSFGIPASITLGVISPGGRGYYERYFEPYIGDAGSPHEESLSGVGDKAARDSSGTSITAVEGDALVDVQYVDVMSKKEGIAQELVEAALSRLP